MRKKIACMALAAAMEALQHIKPPLKTVGYKISSNIKGYIPSSPSGRVRRSRSKYKPHQGKQECARRLRQYSAAWYASKVTS